MEQQRALGELLRSAWNEPEHLSFSIKGEAVRARKLLGINDPYQGNAAELGEKLKEEDDCVLGELLGW